MAKPKLILVLALCLITSNVFASWGIPNYPAQKITQTDQPAKTESPKNIWDDCTIPSLIESSFNKAIANGKVVVEFYSLKCPFCQDMVSVVEEFKKDNPKIKLYRVEVDSQRQFVLKQSIQSWPTFLIFNQGKLAGKLKGKMPKEAFSEGILNPTLPSEGPTKEQIKARIYDLMLIMAKTNAEMQALEKQLN